MNSTGSRPRPRTRSCALNELPAIEAAGSDTAAAAARSRATVATTTLDRIARERAALECELRFLDDEILQLAADVRPIFEAAAAAPGVTGIEPATTVWHALEALAHFLAVERSHSCG